MGTSTLYEMGLFLETDSPFDDYEKIPAEDFSDFLRRIGYKKSCHVGTEDFPFIEIYEADVFNKEIELCYSFYAIVSIDCMNGRDLFFFNWWDVLHFLENYSSWAKNLEEIQKIALEISKLSQEVEDRENLDKPEYGYNR